MSHKHVLFHSEAREKVLKGAATLTEVREPHEERRAAADAFGE